MNLPAFPFALLLLLVVGCHSPGTTPVRPNIVLINVDDLGWKDVGFMGSQYYETPNIDYLAGLGMVFTDGYAAAANCAPSRACLMTGRWTPRHGIYTVASSERGAAKDRKLVPTENTQVLTTKLKTLPAVLRENGYLTCHAGKWHLSEDPRDYGFDLNIGGGFNGMPRSYYPPYKNVDLTGHPDQHLTDLVMDKVVATLDTAQQPLFLYYAPYAVHVPIQPIPDLLPKYDGKPGWRGQQNPAYATMVETLDKNIGRLTAKLKQQGVFDNTLIIFTSDNGGLYGITQQQPLRAGKGSYYEGGIREPFFFVLPGRIGAQSTSNAPITNLDIFPTILTYAQNNQPTLDLDGQSLTPILEATGELADRPLFWHFPVYLQAYDVTDNENRDSLFRTRPGSAIRYQDWKLHYYFEDQDVELYNLIDDIGERNNLADKHPEKATELLTLLQNWWIETGAPLPETLNPDYVE